MKSLILRLGRNKSIVLITLLSIVMSVVITTSLYAAFGQGHMPKLMLTTAVVAPALIAPLMSSYFADLVFTIQRLEQEQRRLATYDGLTQVMTRRAFIEHSNLLLQQHTPPNDNVALAVVDLDHFKKINDAHGHGGGDRVLQDFGRILRQSVRPADLVGRLGGEEFAITLVGLDASKAWLILERIRRTVEATPVPSAAQPIGYTMSAGLCDLTQCAEARLEQLIAQADEALYAAKETGRNRVEIWRPQLALAPGAH
jgi:diguanylate cyclase (GGDEF)-like protein